ncbi:RNA-directed DNA polymerase [Myxococcota bacterium]|nr:RNA-directed DNA polymerase [Myxococcota bacterium]
MLTRPLRPEAMACRPGLGAHRAVLSLLRLMRRHRHVLHLDIRAYFPSVDHDILRALLARRVRDRPFLDVMDRALEADRGLYDRPEARAWAGLTPDWPPPGRGLPIGAATSQALAAHLYLNDLDHHVKRVLRAPGYVRYVDDLFLFADTRGALRQARAAIGEWLQRERGLRLKHPLAPILSCAGHLDGLGYRVTRAGLTVRPRALRRLSRRARWQLAGRPGPSLARSFASSAGVVLF